MSERDITQSPLYSEDLAPIPPEKRTWNMWNMAAIWVGMAVCIPTYILASYMIKSGLGWVESLVIIMLANVLVALPMVLNGHAGVKYGIPFPVMARSSFGFAGVHLPSIVRGIVACGWFGIQTWIGGLAIYAIGCAVVGKSMAYELTAGKFVGFGLFWLINIYFVWKGTESIKWLESYAAPILVLMGIFLIGWGAVEAGGFGVVLEQGKQMQGSTAWIESDASVLAVKSVSDLEGQPKADRVFVVRGGGAEQSFPLDGVVTRIPLTGLQADEAVQVQLGRGEIRSSQIQASLTEKSSEVPGWMYLLWLNAMVGFWATMAISISDITRFVKTQKEQIAGQFIGLPGTMVLYSFVGVFVTCAALVLFDDVLIAEDAPWDPVTLLGKFENPIVVVFAQFFMLIATLSTNIAANVIAPAYAFSNAFPKKLSFFGGGLVTGVVGIVIAPWYLLDRISGLLIFVSGFLGPVLGVLIADYFLVKKKVLDVNGLYDTDGPYRFRAGFNPIGLIALTVGVLVAMTGLWVESLSWLYTLSWFTGFSASFVVHAVGSRMFSGPSAAESGGANHG